MKHEMLIKQWAEGPENTGVFVKPRPYGQWYLDTPSWDPDIPHVLNNSWSQLARKAIDEPNIIIEFEVPAGSDQWRMTDSPEWNPDVNYRIHEMEYDNLDPELIPPQGLLCWISDTPITADNKVIAEIVIGYSEEHMRYTVERGYTWNFCVPVTMGDLDV